MKPFKPINSYSISYPKCDINTYDYLVRRFGAPNNILVMYFYMDTNDVISNIIKDIEDYYKRKMELVTNLQNSESFRLGNFILTPVIWLKHLIRRG